MRLNLKLLLISLSNQYFYFDRSWSQNDVLVFQSPVYLYGRERSIRTVHSHLTNFGFGMGFFRDPGARSKKSENPGDSDILDSSSGGVQELKYPTTTKETLWPGSIYSSWVISRWLPIKPIPERLTGWLSQFLCYSICDIFLSARFIEYFHSQNSYFRASQQQSSSRIKKEVFLKSLLEICS